MKKIILFVCLVLIPVKFFALESTEPVVVLTGHKAQVRSIVFTKDSKQIVTASLDSFMKIFSLKTGETSITIGYGAMVENMAYSRDGRYLVSSGRDQSMKLWDAKNGKLLRMPVNAPGLIFSLAFSPDSDFIASGSLRTVNIWKTGDLKQPFVLDNSGNWARVVSFSPDARFFLAAGGNKITVWTVEYGDIISAITGRGGVSFKNRREFDFGCMIFDAAFSDDSQYFTACGDDGSVKTWRAEDGLAAWKQPAHNGIALCLAFSKDYLATAGKDAMINFFDIKSGQPVFSVSGCMGQANELAFSPDGKFIAAACADNSVPVWRVQKSAPVEFGRVRVVVLALGLLGLAGITAILMFVFRKKKSVKDWSL
jgi:WD40 repeat protein